MKQLNANNAAAISYDLNAGANLKIDNDTEYIQLPGRPVIIYMRVHVGRVKALLQTNTQILTLIPNVSSSDTYDSANDLKFPAYSFANNSSEEAEVMIGPIGIPTGRYLRLVCTSSDVGDTAVGFDAGAIQILDASPGDIDYILGVLTTSTGTAGLLDTNAVEIGGETPIANGTFVLDSTGLDGISIVEPSGDPSTWNWRQWQMWALMRFANQGAQTGSAIKVYNSAGAIITSQTITKGATESITRVEAP